MILMPAYWNGRDEQYRDQLTEEIQQNAERTVSTINEGLVYAGRQDIETVASGWRPPEVNEHTANAATGSNHLKALAADLPDHNRALAYWSATHLADLEALGIWMEDPRWTWSPHGNHWVHWQIVPPKSGKRIYIPSSKPPLDPDFPVTW